MYSMLDLEIIARLWPLVASQNINLFGDEKQIMILLEKIWMAIMQEAFCGDS